MALYVNEFEADSTIYSFANKLPDIASDTVYVKIRLQGPAADYSRSIQLQATSGTTAIDGVEYELPVYEFPAGATEARYPVVLLRGAALKEATKYLYVAIKPNDHFQKAAIGQEIGKTYSIESYKIRFNDFLSEPSWWSTLESYLGEFSVVKLQFVYSVYGNDYDFEGLYYPVDYYGTIYWTYDDEVNNMPLRLRTALRKYEEDNGPLLDENGNRLTF
ncbi:hypothetical protein GCM10011418_03470 [Sphingobacterium alkalisoli]|nr:hypothetical protein GCM10011418_03470 [Sphingobacterium alkalisoli]